MPCMQSKTAAPCRLCGSQHTPSDCPTENLSSFASSSASAGAPSLSAGARGGADSSSPGATRLSEAEASLAGAPFSASQFTEASVCLSGPGCTDGGLLGSGTGGGESGEQQSCDQRQGEIGAANAPELPACQPSKTASSALQSLVAVFAFKRQGGVPVVLTYG